MDSSDYPNHGRLYCCQYGGLPRSREEVRGRTSLPDTTHHPLRGNYLICNPLAPKFGCDRGKCIHLIATFNA